MFDESQVQWIVAYLLEHRQRFSPEALRAQLLSQNIPAEAIDEAFRRIFANEAPHAPPPQSRTRSFAVSLVLYVASTVASFAGNLVLGIMYASVTASLNIDGAFFALCACTAVAEIALAIVYVRKHPSIAAGVISGLVIVPATIVIVILAAFVLLLNECTKVFG